MEELYDYVKFISELLKIDIPFLKIITDKEMQHICGSETMAFYNRTLKTIFLQKKEEYFEMDYYLLFHEIRHAWQDITDPFYYFDDYNNNLSEHEYNISVAEIDANAFACVAMAIIFNINTKRTYGKDNIAQIKYNNRLEQLKKQYNIDF